MFSDFSELQSYLTRRHVKARLVLAGAHDDAALKAVVDAKREGVVSGVLVGRQEEIVGLLNDFGEDPAEYELIDCRDDRLCAETAVRMVREGAADMVMKGLMMTATYMRAILDKEHGLVPPDALLSQATVVGYPRDHRLVVVSDCAVNITPGYDDKVKIIKNAVALAKRLGIDMPKVAVLSALEVVNPKIPGSEEAQRLSQAAWDGCVVEGPYGLDNALSPEAAAHKNITGRVAGKADVLIMPDICAGNIMTKTLTYFGGLTAAGALCGTDRPVVMTSRTDSPDSKLASIYIAMLQLAK